MKGRNEVRGMKERKEGEKEEKRGKKESIGQYPHFLWKHEK